MFKKLKDGDETIYQSMCGNMFQLEKGQVRMSADKNQVVQTVGE